MSIKKDIEIRSFRWFANESDEALVKWRDENNYPEHIRPFSTLVVGVGHHWHDGCFEAVYDMSKYTFDHGYEVTFYEEHDRCFAPYDALGIMRNLAYMKAITEGYEFLLYVDNDVKPPVDALFTLLHKYVPIISPIVVYADGEHHDQALSKMERDKGLAMTSSVPLSFVLFQTKVFIPWATTPFWQDAIGADESYHFKKLDSAGHHPFVATDVVVTAMSPPHYPLDDTIDRTVESLNPVTKIPGPSKKPSTTGLFIPRHI